MHKKRYLKNNIIYMLYDIKLLIVFFNIMLIAELNTCYLFYLISVITVYIINRIIIKYGKRRTIKELIIII